jgi:hypothetical protein
MKIVWSVPDLPPLPFGRAGVRETLTASAPYIFRNGAGAMTLPKISSPSAYPLLEPHGKRRIPET